MADVLGDEVRAQRYRMFGLGCAALVAIACLGLYVYSSFSEEPEPAGPWMDVVVNDWTLQFRSLDAGVGGHQRQVLIQGQPVVIPNFAGGSSVLNVYFTEGIAGAGPWVYLVDVWGEYVIDFGRAQVGRVKRCEEESWLVVDLDRAAVTAECEGGQPVQTHRPVPVRTRGTYLGRVEWVDGAPTFLADAPERDIVVTDL